MMNNLSKHTVTIPFNKSNNSSNVVYKYSFVKSNSCCNVFHNRYGYNTMLSKCKNGNSFTNNNNNTNRSTCCYGKKYTSYMHMNNNSNNNKIKKKLLNISDSILNEKKTHSYIKNKNINISNINNISSIECKARDILKNSPSQKKLIKCGLFKKYNANKVKQIFHPNHGKFNTTRKQTQIDHTKYMNELKKAFLINK